MCLKIKQPGLEMLVVRQPMCTACEATIPMNNVRIKHDKPDQPGATMRTVQAYCEHCNILYQQRERLQSGEWRSVGNAVVLAGREERAEFMRRTAQNRLEKQIAHAG